MRRACRIYERLDPQPLELLPLLDELATHIGFELDFEREARSADRVRELFARRPARDRAAHPPASTRRKRVLMMELVARHQDHRQGRDRSPPASTRAEVVQDLMRVYVHMIMADGFFQADPHPGNLLVTPDGQLIAARLRPLQGAARGLRPRPVRADVLDDDAERVGDDARLPGARLRDQDRRRPAPSSLIARRMLRAQRHAAASRASSPRR